METLNVNQSELLNLLLGIQKPTLCNVVMETEFVMLRTNNPYQKGEITKVSSRNYSIGGSYENRVNNNRVKEDKENDFVSEKPSGKTHISKSVLVDDKTGSVHYLMLEYYTKIKPSTYLNKNGVEVVDPIELALINSFVSKSFSGNDKQGLEKEVTVITPKVSNIKSITLDHKKYVVV